MSLSYMQMDATTPNTVDPRMLGVVASVLAVVSKRMQQLPITLGHAVHRGKDTTYQTSPCVMRVVGRAVQTDPTLLSLSLRDQGTKEILGVVGSNV